jgi:hypothetical protein
VNGVVSGIQASLLREIEQFKPVKLASSLSCDTTNYQGLLEGGLR